MVIPGLHIDPDSDVPVYRQIADGVREAALDGRLAAGHRLPPTRDLARQLGVNRNTVIAAYDSLGDEGWVKSHTGRGTFVSVPPRLGEAGARVAGPPDEPWTTTFSRAVDGPAMGGLLSMFRLAIAGGGISFSGSYPAPELMPVEPFGRALATALCEYGERILAYGPTAGLPRLRERIAALMRDAGSATDAEQVLVTSGAQQAIDLVFHAFLERGDAVVIEEPTYAGALSVLGSIGARVVGVPVDAEGLRPDLLALALERQRPRLLYVQPSFHNPTTAVMSEARRREVLAIAARHRCMIVEDDWASGLLNEGAAPPTLHALDGGRRVIYVNTFSKKLLPGLRLGWISAPTRVMERLVALKQIRDCGSSPLLQAGLELFLREGGLDEHLRRVLPAYRERRDSMLAALARHMPEGVHWTRPDGGLFVWVTLPRGFDGDDLFLAAQRERVFYSKGRWFHSAGDGDHTLRLTFSAVSPEQIEEGVRILGTLVRERWSDRAGAPPHPSVEAMPIL